MPSLRYRLMEAMLRLMRVRRALQVTGSEAQRAFDAAWQASEPRPSVPRSYEGRDVQIAGRPCYRIRPRCGKPTGAVLYLNGGGFMRPASRRDFSLAERLAERSGREVWLFCYPLEPRHRIHAIVEATLDAYRSMLLECPPDGVAFFGLSSGACLCLYLLVYLRQEGLDVPFPGRVILNSPVVELPPHAEQLVHMERLDATDCVLPASYLGPDGLISCMLRAEPSRWLYLSRVLEADMHGWPPMTIVFGTNETPYAYAEDFMGALQRAHVPAKLIAAQGCGHCATT